MFILITVPHSFCIPTSPKRMCDLRAVSCATLLQHILTNMDVKNKMIKMHIPRSLVDANRNLPDTKNPLSSQAWLNFNTRIVDVLEREIKQEIMLFDIHSFPKGSFKEAQIAIIDIYHKERPELKQFAQLIKKDLNINVQVFNGAGNYIQDRYQSYAYPVLIEFCEDKSYLTNADIKRFFDKLLEFYGI